jgi:hypothetical protein
MFILIVARFFDFVQCIRQMFTLCTSNVIFFSEIAETIACGHNSAQNGTENFRKRLQKREKHGIIDVSVNKTKS